MNYCSSPPSELKITDLRVANINHVPKHCILLKIETNRGVGRRVGERQNLVITNVKMKRRQSDGAA